MQWENSPTNQLMMHGSIALSINGVAPKVAIIKTSTFAAAQRFTSVQYRSIFVINQSINQWPLWRCPFMSNIYNRVMLDSRILRQSARDWAYPAWTSSSNERGTTFDNHSINQSLWIPTIVVLLKPYDQSRLASIRRSITMTMNGNPMFNQYNFSMWSLNIKTIPSYGTWPRHIVTNTEVYNSIQLFNIQGREAIQSWVNHCLLRTTHHYSVWWGNEVIDIPSIHLGA